MQAVISLHMIKILTVLNKKKQNKGIKMPKLLTEAEINKRIKFIIRSRARIKPMTWGDIAKELGINLKSLYFFRSRYMQDTI